MSLDSCAVCGGDGRLSNSFGSQARCPSCHGTGRRSDEGGMRDVTKTKPSHHRAANASSAPVKQTAPETAEGKRLAAEIAACATISSDTKARLVREIIEYEGSHGKCTDTFAKKVRRQLRAPS